MSSHSKLRQRVKTDIKTQGQNTAKSALPEYPWMGREDRPCHP